MTIKLVETWVERMARLVRQHRAYPSMTEAQAARHEADIRLAAKSAEMSIADMVAKLDRQA